MKNKGRKHKATNGNAKGGLTFITRDIRKMSMEDDTTSSKFTKKKWHKRVRGYFKSQTKNIFDSED